MHSEWKRLFNFTLTNLIKQLNILGEIDVMQCIKNEFVILETKKHKMINFEQYDKENPQIWEAFKSVTLEAIHEKGFKNYGARGIFEIIRWKTATPNGNDGFKVNNSFTSDYARKFMNEFPQHEGFFRLRMQKAQRQTSNL